MDSGWAYLKVAVEYALSTGAGLVEVLTSAGVDDVAAGRGLDVGESPATPSVTVVSVVFTTVVPITTTSVWVESPPDRLAAVPVVPLGGRSGESRDSEDETAVPNGTSIWCRCGLRYWPEAVATRPSVNAAPTRILAAFAPERIPNRDARDNQVRTWGINACQRAHRSE